MAEQLQAGVGRAVITPPAGIAHAGWGAQLHQRARGVDLDLWATALALKQGDTKAVIIDLDLIGLEDQEMVAVRQAVAELTQIPLPQVRISYSHTHSGPNLGLGQWFAAGAEMIAPYVQSLPHRIASAAREAVQNLRPARAIAGSGTSAIAVNRRYTTPDGQVVVGRNWNGPVDHEVKVVRIDDLEERPLAILFNYACHPIIMAWENEFITPDYPGPARRVVEQALGAPALFLQGAAGDIQPVRSLTGDRAVYHRLGAMLGHEVAKVALSLETRPRRERFVQVLRSGADLAIYADEPIGEPDNTLQVATQVVELPLRKLPPIPEARAEAARCREELAALQKRGASAGEIRDATYRAKRAAMWELQANRYAGQTHTTWEVQAICIGDIALVATPGEPFVKIALAVKAGSPFRHTLFSGYSNGGLGYMPMPEDYAVGGYEPTFTQFAPEAAGILIEGALALLRGMAGYEDH